MTTKILWLSRHAMTDEQEAALRNKFPNGIEIIPHRDQVKNWKEVADLGKDCDVLAVVLPPTILGELVNPRNNSKPVIRAVSSQCAVGTVVNPATGEEEIQYAFQFQGWQRVLRISIETEPYC